MKKPLIFYKKIRGFKLAEREGFEPYRLGGLERIQEEYQ
jgi:hypothetical protein